MNYKKKGILNSIYGLLAQRMFDREMSHWYDVRNRYCEWFEELAFNYNLCKRGLNPVYHYRSGIFDTDFWKETDACLTKLDKYARIIGRKEESYTSQTERDAMMYVYIYLR